MAKSVTHTSSKSKTSSQTQSKTKGRSESQSESYARKVLDQELVDQIMGGLMGYMSDEEISEYAQNLLNPQLNAGIEEAQHNYETTKLAKEQEIENLAQSLQKSIAEQERAYGKSVANIETGALARGMGRSSYTMQTIANQGSELARAVQGLTDENQRLSGQLQNQITLAAQQNSRTQGRLKTDYASQLAAKVQELRQNQRDSYNQNYLTAVSGAMGQKTTGSQSTTSESETDSRTNSTTTGSSTSVTTTSGGGGGRKSTTTVNQ